MKFYNRVTQLPGIEIPIVQAPMGWIARSQLASAVSNAGDMEAAITLTGKVCGRIENVKPVADIIAETSREFFEIIASRTKSYGQQT